jgi:hypothetical protein
MRWSWWLIVILRRPGGIWMLNLVSSRQVTLLVATPVPPEVAPAGVPGAASDVWVSARRAGQTVGEIDPGTEELIVGGGPDLRVRTFKIETRRRP